MSKSRTFLSVLPQFSILIKVDKKLFTFNENIFGDSVISNEF